MQAQPNRGMPFADVTLPAACAGCEGALAVRLSAAGAQSYCPVCHLVGRMAVARDGEHLRMVAMPAALA
jgi:hypothetical protein